MSEAFVLDERLDADTFPITEMQLCRLLAMNDTRFSWLILVPKRPKLVELLDLSKSERFAVREEIDRVAATLQRTTSCDKLNIAAIGNVVQQLHIHVVARFRSDPAWPSPVWGFERAIPMNADTQVQFQSHFLQELSHA